MRDAVFEIDKQIDECIKNGATGETEEEEPQAAEESNLFAIGVVAALAVTAITFGVLKLRSRYWTCINLYWSFVLKGHYLTII